MGFLLKMLTALKNTPERILLQRNICSPVTIPKNYYASEAKLPLKAFQLYKLDKGPPPDTTLTRDDALLYYRQMKVIRDMETVAAKLYREKQIRGFCHLASGQEACNVGMRAAMRPQDSIISAYRVHGIAYTMGISVTGVLAELTGRKSGCVKGKGGSMHMYTKNFYGGNGIVGSQVPLGAGIAFASKYLGSDGACFTLYGDGAANQGQVFEAYNLSKLLSLPVIYVCENNHYAMGTPKARGSASIEYYKRGDYIPGIWVDGMSILEVREGCRFAIEFTKTNGPIVMELETYRYHGHSMSDPGVSYRSRDEIQTVRQTQDPINLFKDKIIKADLVTEDDLKKLDNEIKTEIADATKHALNDPEIPIEELAYDIYSMSLEDEIRGCHPWQIFKHKLSGKILNL